MLSKKEAQFCYLMHSLGYSQGSFNLENEFKALIKRNIGSLIKKGIANFDGEYYRLDPDLLDTELMAWKNRNIQAYETLIETQVEDLFLVL